MKTIFITIPLGIVARNILRTDVFRILKSQKDLRIILIIPPKIDINFRKELEGNNVIIEERLKRVRAGIFRHFILYPFMRNLVYTDTSRIFFKYGKTRHPEYRPMRYILSLIFILPLSKITILKRICRWVDFNFFKRYDKEFEDLFDKYKPSLVFVTALLNDPPVCRTLVRIAKRRRIPSVGMVKSWDQLDKYLLITLPDTFIVWNDKMKNDLIKYQDFRSGEIVMTGIPQFDIYFQNNIFLSRKQYCQQMGIDPSKKILFFGSSGFVFPYDDEFVDILQNIIFQKKIREKVIILVRPHFHELILKTGRFDRFRNNNDYPDVVLDKEERGSECFLGAWNPTKEEMIHLTNNLYHCDIMITAFSTLPLDAAAFDKPIINIAFDGLYKRSKVDSYLKHYKTAHYREVIKTRAVKLVYNKKELGIAINEYIKNPNLDWEGRERLRQKFCYRLDGKAGKRIAECLLKKIN
jgi:hypothetical protein